eukprot:TRINITY_DN981_c0_g4_i1.p1 TRINITY_DN981_c0_g4~~TRINITY_DN981_c0_g4_i1.p1  ORF type:complete len:258 (+),score=111.40 TRINITY_DN981_c0_g4_i1:87-860(+)
MSNFNVGQKRTYKERAQPKERKGRGLLEKKRDYLLRAKDYKRKQRKLKKLALAAELKNPDEFYFGMQRARVDKTGAHMVIEDKSHSHKDLSRMDGEDLRYLTTRQVEEMNRVERLRASLHDLQHDDDDASSSADEPAARAALAATVPKAKHVLFVPSTRALDRFSAAKHFGTVDEAVGRVYNRVRKEQLESDTLPEADVEARVKSYNELAARRSRLATIARMRQDMKLRKELRKGGRVRKEKRGDKVVYKWAKQRKR